MEGILDVQARQEANLGSHTQWSRVKNPSPAVLIYPPLGTMGLAQQHRLWLFTVTQSTVPSVPGDATRP